MKQVVLFRLENSVLWRVGCLFEQHLELGMIWHEIFKRQHLRRSLSARAPNAPAAILRNRVEPGSQRFRIGEASQVIQGPEQNILRSILGILAVPAHLHAERINGALQQVQSSFNRLGRLFA
jgi:hypothetical protein